MPAIYGQFHLSNLQPARPSTRKPLISPGHCLLNRHRTPDPFSPLTVTGRHGFTADDTWANPSPGHSNRTFYHQRAELARTGQRPGYSSTPRSRRHRIQFDLDYLVVGLSQAIAGG